MTDLVALQEALAYASGRYDKAEKTRKVAELMLAFSEDEGDDADAMDRFKKHREAATLAWYEAHTARQDAARALIHFIGFEPEFMKRVL